MLSRGWRWALGLAYIVAVAIIWIAASYIVQSVVDTGVSPFLITYICNSLFVIYIPIIEIARYLEDSVGFLWFRFSRENDSIKQQLKHSEKVALLGESNSSAKRDGFDTSEFGDRKGTGHYKKDIFLESESGHHDGGMILPDQATSSAQLETSKVSREASKEVDAKGRWTRTRMAKVGLLISPFWFLAQLTFNLSLKYTTVTSNTLLSSVSSLFTFLVSLAFLGEKFTFLKLISVLLCMGGTIIVGLGDSTTGANEIASNPLLGDILALVSAALYSVYITLIRKKIPDEDKGEGRPSMAQFLGFVGLFNLLIFLPVALVLNFTKLEPFYKLSWKQFALIIGKGLLDNVLSDYLWAQAVLLTTPTATTAGLTIQVPMAAVVDTIIGQAPHLMDYIGGAAIMVGFVGINISPEVCCSSGAPQNEETENVAMVASQDQPA
ncbi:thiamine-repressible mitochondrial transport protein THI74 [Cinnamomum micranthum f. kanehirae]|uniref:Thiamine-repressible mitochondrial transport protein THI74 n=1 Tax=Cinnamomum micranthum f. kanehirae TaxID=337451 RepID=A0A3S3MX19_9MAGN|nr:thiamine-repressible mitochondrial transport protein THI74 [Cinnamomum micranthum f. kanehirae]